MRRVGELANCIRSRHCRFRGCFQSFFLFLSLLRDPSLRVSRPFPLSPWAPPSHGSPSPGPHIPCPSCGPCSPVLTPQSTPIPSYSFITKSLSLLFPYFSPHIHIIFFLFCFLHLCRTRVGRIFMQADCERLTMCISVTVTRGKLAY